MLHKTSSISEIDDYYLGPAITERLVLVYVHYWVMTYTGFLGTYLPITTANDSVPLVF